jgi:mevalonate kinase
VSPICHTRIPAKLILFGEWGVLKKYPALGVALDKYFVSTIEETHEEGLFIESPECTFHWKEKESKAPEFLKTTQEALLFIFKNPFEVLNKKKLKLVRNWKMSEGLGSSSALFLSLLLLRHKLLFEKNKINFEDILSFQQKLIEFQGGGSGFDLLIQACGGFVRVNPLKKQILHLPPELLFVHTGNKMKTHEALETLYKSPNSLHDKIFSEIGKSTENFLSQQNWEICIHEHFELLKMLGVVPDFVLALQKEWVEKKWISSLKTTGAGGGDTLVLWTNPDYKKELLQDLIQKGFWIDETKPSSASVVDF